MALITTQKNTISDHGDLLGLGDDDHTQYLLVDGSRQLSANWDAGAFNITADDILVDDDIYAAGWNANLKVPTKNAVYDKIETIVSSALSISNNVNNYLLTATGTNSINGESNLTFSGITLSVSNGTDYSNILTSGGFIFNSITNSQNFEFTPYDIWMLTYTGVTGYFGLDSLDDPNNVQFHFKVNNVNVITASHNLYQIGAPLEVKDDFGLSNYAAVKVDTIETTITNDDTHLPTSGAIVDYCVGFTNVTNNTNNYLLTATGTTAINGEANLTFDGSTLVLTGEAHISGDVGIGTTSPDKLLQISAVDNATIRIESTDVTLTTDQVIGDLDWYSNDNSADGTGISGRIRNISEDTYGVTTALLFETRDDDGSVLSEKMRITSNGNVGIGTTSPLSKLHIEDITAGIHNLIALEYGSANNDGAGLVWQAGATKIGNIEQVRTAAGEYSIIFNNWDGASNAEIMRIKGSNLAGSNKVGIGTTSPGEKLHVRNSGVSQIKIETTTEGAGGYAGLTFHAPITGTPTQQGYLRWDDNANRFTWYTADHNIHLWTGTGNVGIGTGAPTELLDINSDAIRIRTSQTPASAGAAGTTGMICWDSSYIYICTATNTWKRTSIATW